MENFIQIAINAVDAAQQDLLIGQLSSIEFEGFEQERNTLKAYIPKELFDKEALRNILGEFDYSITEIPHVNWNQEWEKNFQPVLVDDFCAIRAGFHQPIQNVAHEIVITIHHMHRFFLIFSSRLLIFRIPGFLMLPPLLSTLLSELVFHSHVYQ